MPLWSFLGVVTAAPDRYTFDAELDLGMRWRHPVTVHIAGLKPKLGSPIALDILALLPTGTRFVAVCERIDLQDPIRAHVLLEDGTDVAGRVRKRRDVVPPWAYGGGFDKTWAYPAIVDHATDADTVVVQLNTGTRTHLTAPVRVAHVDAPEHGTAEGDAATVWAEHLLKPGTSVDIRSHQLDKYGRILGDVLLDDGTNFGAALVDAGHAVPYEGGAR